MSDLLGRRRDVPRRPRPVRAPPRWPAGSRPRPGCSSRSAPSRASAPRSSRPPRSRSLTVTFPAGRERNIALGVWGALAAIGGTLGVVAGGVLVDSAGWEWIFFVNVPVALLALLRDAAASWPRAGAPAARGLRLRRRGARHRRRCSRSSTASSAPTPRAGAPPRCSVCSSPPSSCSARSSRSSPAPPIRSSRCSCSASAGCSVSAIALGAQRRRLPRHVLHHRALPAAGARRQRARRRHPLPADGDRRDRLCGGRRAARHAGRARAPSTSPDRRSASSGCSLLGRAGADAGYATDILPGLVIFASGCRSSASATRSPRWPRSRTSTPARPPGS